MPIKLPEARSAAPATEPPALTLTVNAAGSVFIDDQPLALTALDERLAGLPTTARVVLKVDKATPFGAFVAVIDRLKSHHLDQLSIRTVNDS